MVLAQRAVTADSDSRADLPEREGRFVESVSARLLQLYDLRDAILEVNKTIRNN